MVGYPYYNEHILETNFSGSCSYHKNKKRRNFGRKFRRAIKRALRRPKFLKVQQKLLKFEIYSRIYSIAVVTPNSANRETIATLFKLCIQQAYSIMMLIGGWIFKHLKSGIPWLYQFLKKNRWFMLASFFTGCALLHLDYLVRDFQKELSDSWNTWWVRILRFLLWILGVCFCLYFIARMMGYKTIPDFIKAILFEIFQLLIWIKKRLEKESQVPVLTSPLRHQDPKASQITAGSDDWKKAVAVMITVTAIGKYLLERFKHQIVGNGPVPDLVISLIDNKKKKNFQILKLSQLVKD